MKGVLFVDDDVCLCRTMKVVIETISPVPCTCVNSFSDVRSHETKLAQFGLVLLDVNLGATEPSGIEIYHWLLEKAYSGRVVFCTGHARANPLVQEALTTGAELIEKPVGIERFERLLADVFGTAVIAR